jgi:hypothetical protein
MLEISRLWYTIAKALSVHMTLKLTTYLHEAEGFAILIRLEVSVPSRDGDNFSFSVSKMALG